MTVGENRIENTVEDKRVQVPSPAELARVEGRSGARKGEGGPFPAEINGVGF